MIFNIGILFALIALLSWGFGDYFIQKVSRSLGIWKSIFFISIIGLVILTPFVIHQIPNIFQGKHLLFFGMAAFVMVVVSVFDFEALKQGKLSIIEPIFSIELPVAAILAVLFWGESLSVLNWLLIVAIFLGTTLVVTQYHTDLHYHKRILEKGVILALAAALCTAVLDVLMGASSQTAQPLLTVWAVWVGTGVVSFIYLAAHGKIKELWGDIKKYPLPILGLGVFDTLGWLGFCLATSHLPIAIATAIAESYIVITIGLGMFVNHEKLKWHQKAGVFFVTVSVIVLAYLSH